VIAAAIASVAGVVLFVVLGGVGLAQSAVALAEDRSGHRGQNQDDKKIVICHKGKNTISISVNAWPAHQRHGDTEGECAAAATTQTKTKKPKKSTQTAAAVAATTAGTTKEPKSAGSSSTPPHGKHKGKPALGPKKPKKEKGQNQHVPAPPVAPTGTESTGPGNGNGNGHGNGNGKGKNE
jgi:hypothetical protein